MAAERRWWSDGGKSYNSGMTCSICEGRKAKRFCPALRSEICPQCCGKEREETIDCPLECSYLMESREHEKTAGIHPDEFPYKEIRITESFLRDREELLNAVGQFVVEAAFQTHGAADQDAREALDALVRTYKSLESGVYYQTMPQSPIGQAIVMQVEELLQRFRAEETRRTGMTRTRDADVFGILVFLLRMALDENNGRKRGRRFLHSLVQHFLPDEPSQAQSSLIVPG